MVEKRQKINDSLIIVAIVILVFNSGSYFIGESGKFNSLFTKRAILDCNLN